MSRAEITRISSLRSVETTRYHGGVIQSFRHRGLERLYEDDDRRGIRGDLVNRVRSILARLDVAETLEDLA